MKRKIIAAILALALCLTLAVSVSAAPDVSFIVDAFDLLTDSEIAALNALAAEIYDERGVGIFFVFTYEEDLADYDVDTLVGGITDYFVMIENETSWYTFMGGKGSAIDVSTEEYLRDIYDYADTYEGGIRDFLNASAECFPIRSNPPESTTPQENTNPPETNPLENTVPAVSEILVYDDAQLLTDAQEAQLNAKLAAISGKYNAQLVVVTIDSMEGGDIDDFLGYLYDIMEFGYGSKRDGVMLLVCMDPREYRILSNGFAADAIESSAIEDIGERFASDLSDGNYAAAFNKFADRSEYYLNGHLNGFPFDFTGNLAIALIIGIVIGVVVAFILKGQLKSVRKQEKAHAYVKADSMHVTIQNDIFLYRDLKRTKKESSSSSSSGSSRNTGGGSF